MATIDFLASDDDAPSHAAGAGYDSDDLDVDITDSLLPSSSSAPPKPTPAKGKAKAKGKGKAQDSNSTAMIDANDDLAHDEDAAFIAQVMQAQNVKAGAEVAKMAKGKGKGKNKLASGILSGGGSFQSMGLHPALLRSLLLRGFNTPTPIQRQAIPAILNQPPRDVVGMARTGSGKTLAYLIPLIQRLNGRHSRTFGIKSLIFCPSRELALQILKVGKEIARGWKSDPGEGQDTRGEAIRWAMIVGGEGMDEQFALMSNNPDVVIATPGRMLHLTVEMNLDLKSVEYLVFDEADRLFEMGFADQLEEMLLRLPPTRQTLLFSATLPKQLVEFARAGLQDNPKLVRLDADSKISSELRMAFFSVKPSEKEAALLVLLRDVIGVPYGEQGEHDKPQSTDQGYNKPLAGKKRKRPAHASGADVLLPHQTIIFAATKHHVEYLLLLLSTAGYACSHIYSSLDQATRGIQMARFRSGQTSLLIVTDVAARGIDLPVLEHVVNYDFPPQPRTFVHRVGRTARAGRNGWAWSLCTNAELPYLCDLQLFLARPLVSSHTIARDQPLDLHDKLTLGTLSREKLDSETEFIASGLTNTSSSTANDFPALKQVAERAQGKYEKSNAKASQESYRRAKEMIQTGAARDGKVPTWALAGSPMEEVAVHDVLRRPLVYGLKPAGGVTVEGGDAILGVGESESQKPDSTKNVEQAAARAAMLAKVNSFRPGETIFEIGQRGDKTPLAQLMKSRRRTMDDKSKKIAAAEARKADALASHKDDTDASDDQDERDLVELEQADEAEIEGLFGQGEAKETAKRARPSKTATSSKPKAKPTSFKDPNFYLSYEQADAKTERGYALSSTSNSFVAQARQVTYDVGGDETRLGTQTQRVNASRWDTKKKKFVAGDGVGADNKKTIRTESGLRLPASFRSGRFDEWKKEQRLELPKVGEKERESNIPHNSGEKRFAHNKTTAPKRLDPLARDYNRKLKARSNAEESGSGSGPGPKKSWKAKKVNTGSRAKNEIKSARDIYKQRETMAKRKEKNARPSKKKK